MAYKNDLRGFKIPTDVNFWLTEQVRQKTGKAAADIVRNRIRNLRDVNDSLPPAYSPYGPIYIPVSPGFHGGGWKTASTRGVGHHQRFGYGVSRRLAGQRNSAGAISDGYSRTGHSLKFENYAAFKAYLGRSGSRDLEVTGAMLRDIQVTRVDAQAITIGFGDQKQELKMRGNQRYTDSWGFSQTDRNAIFQAFVAMMNERLSRVKLK